MVFCFWNVDTGVIGNFLYRMIEVKRRGLGRKRCFMEQFKQFESCGGFDMALRGGINSSTK
jgi:hypothetical protein